MNDFGNNQILLTNQLYQFEKKRRSAKQGIFTEVL